MVDSLAIQEFLEEVDYDFISPLSSVANLPDLAAKYSRYATLCCEEQDGRIIAMAAGYTENTTDNIGYISLVAALKSHRHKGMCTRLVADFLNVARSKGLTAVHVYTHYSNPAAVAMYRKNGFVELQDSSHETDTAHLICSL